MSENNNNSKKAICVVAVALVLVIGLIVACVVKLNQSKPEKKKTSGKDKSVTVTVGPTKAPETTKDPETTTDPEPTKDPEEGELAEDLITDYEDYIEFTKLPEGYMSISVEDVTQEELDSYIEMVCHDNMIENSVDREIREGDVANIDYAGYLDGVAFEGGTDTGKDLEIGSGEFIEGFEEGLIGAKKGETKKLNLKFPEQYHSEELAGKEVVFEVKINDVIEHILPEFNDSFVETLTVGVCTTTEEFIKQSKEVLLEEKQYYAVMKYMLENSSFEKVNESYVKANMDYVKQEYEMYAAMYGITLDQFIIMSGMGEASSFWKGIEEEIRNEEKQRIALYCVAKEQGIALTEEQFNEAVATLATEYDMTSEEFLQEYDRSFVEQTLLMEHALEVLIDNTVIK